MEMNSRADEVTIKSDGLSKNRISISKKKEKSSTTEDSEFEWNQLMSRFECLKIRITMKVYLPEALLLYKF